MTSLLPLCKKSYLLLLLYYYYYYCCYYHDRFLTDDGISQCIDMCTQHDLKPTAKNITTQSLNVSLCPYTCITPGFFKGI